MPKRKHDSPQNIAANELATGSSCNAEVGASQTEHLALSCGVTTRSKKRLSDQRTNISSFDYTSDGMSFDSENAEDEQLPDVTMVSPNKQKNFMKDDIVWAPFKEVYWPAIVTSVAPPQVRFLYINESGSKSQVFRKHCKLLIPFDNAAKNQELKELGEKHYGDFKDAYERVVTYLVRRSSTKLCARRFLTLSDDKVEQAKDCLFRLGVASYPDDCKLDSEYADGGNDDDSEGGSEICSSPVSGRALRKDEAQIKEILKELEIVPDELKVSTKQCKEMEIEAYELLNVIKSEKCFQYLKKIREGTEMSSRHKRFAVLGLSQGGFGPFTLNEDLKNQLLTVMDSHCEALDPDSEGIDPLYKYSVMLPEAIIYAITKVKKISRNAAKQHFELTSSKVGVHDDIKINS